MIDVEAAAAAAHERLVLAELRAEAAVAAWDAGVGHAWTVELAEARAAEAAFDLERLLGACAQVAGVSGPMSVGGMPDTKEAHDGQGQSEHPRRAALPRHR